MTKERVVLITGATGGIGEHMALRFAKSGYRLALHGLGDEATIASQMDACRALGAEVVHFANDLSKPAEASTLSADVIAKMGAVDVLVNNAGLQYVAPIESHKTDMWDKLIAINLTATFLTMQGVIPSMRSRGWGRIINLSSVHGKVASVHKAAYVASKHGVIGLTRVAALELAGSGVTCNAICPGWVGTPLVWGQVEKRANEMGMSLEKAQQSLVTEKQPSGEMLHPSEVANLCLFLCGDEAKQMQGSALSIDGGWSAQ